MYICLYTGYKFWVLLTMSFVNMFWPNVIFLFPKADLTSCKLVIIVK